MLLSILVPSFNHGRYIAQTLDSCLSQGYEPLEIIVADGGSQDGTVDILRRYSERHPQVRWISEKDRGPADAVNKALAMARGEVAAIQSSDDFYYPGAFTKVMQVFQREPDCGFVIGDYSGIDQAGATLYEELLHGFSWEVCFARSVALPQSSIFFRRALGQAVGGWNAAYFAPDVDFWLKILLRTRAVHVPHILSAWRIYEGQRTHSPEGKRRVWDDYRKMMAETPELRHAPWRVRRLALASEHLLALRSHPTGEAAAVRWHLALGFLLHPTFWRHYPWPIRPWLPGARLGERLRRQWRRLQRRAL